MPTTSYEKILIGALNVNDGVNYELEALTFTPAQKKPNWAGNNDSSGEVLVREPDYTNSYFDLRIRVLPQASMTAALAKLGALTDAVQQCEREDGGQAVPWTPHDQETVYTAYAELGELTELPIEATGDNAGYLFNAPLVAVKLSCRPFLYLPERVVLSAKESGAEPLQVVYVGGIKGDAEAEARMILRDKAGVDRRFAQWGRDIVFSETGLPSLLLPASTSLTGEGFSGTVKSRTGAYGAESKVFRATALSTPTPICGTGRIAHVGSFAVYLRPYVGSADCRFRLSYRNGDGPLIPLEWKTPPVASGFCDMYMGEVSFDAARLGAQASEARIEQMTLGASVDQDVNYLEFIPSHSSARARGRSSTLPAALLVYDNFIQEPSGNLEGKTLGLGGSWGMINRTGANGWQLDATAHRATRTLSSDASPYLGCFGLAGSTSYSAIQVSAFVGFNRGAGGSSTQVLSGLLARYVNLENWVVLGVLEFELSVRELALVKSVGGVITTTKLGKVAPVSGERFLSFSIGADGAWNGKLSTAPGGSTMKTGSGSDSDLAAGGALAAGKVGIYDACAISGPGTVIRTLDTFSVTGVEQAGRVCFANRQIEFNSVGAERQDPTGVYDGQPSVYRGGDLFLDPAGSSGRINRLAVRMRPNDIEVEPDTSVTLKQSVEVLVRERVLTPR